MTLRYQPVSPEHLRGAVRALDQRLAVAQAEAVNASP